MTHLNQKPFEPVELLLVDGSNKKISYVTYVEQFKNLAKKIKDKGLSLKKLSELARIEFDKLISFFKDNKYMSPGEQAAIQKALQ